MKHWFITGISRGFGLAIAKAALAQGDKVVGTIRSEEPDLEYGSDQLRTIKVDMSDDEGVVAAVHEAFAAFGRIDVIVNNAGYGVLGAIETSTDEDLHKMFQVNVFTPIRIIRTALPYLRDQASGHVINITSIAGRAPGVGSGLYAITKFAMEGCSASLAQEVASFGIKVTAVAPGQFRTDFLAAAARQSDGAAASYGGTVGTALDSLFSTHHNQLGDPELGARAIVEAANSEHPPLHLLLGSDALKRAQSKLQAVEEEMSAWEAVTVSTDFR